jgi:hypothetical protein
MSYLDEAKSYYDRQYPGDDTAPIGATEEEVHALEQRLSVQFPGAHREFLLWMGKDHAGVLSDARWYVRDLELLTKLLPKWLEYNRQEAPAPGTFICCYNYAGYANAWYKIPSEDEDPLIYLFVEGDEKHPEPFIWGSFSDWVLEFMEGSHMPIMRQRQARKEHEEEQARLRADASSAGASNAPAV